LLQQKIVKNFIRVIIVLMIEIKRFIQEAEIHGGEKVADFGAGSGFIALELAKAVGPTGEVAAIDILEEPLEVLETRAKNLKLFNIRTIKSDLEKENGSTLQSNSCDLVVIVNLLFQVEEPKTIAKEAKRILKAGGKAVVIEWLPQKLIGKENQFVHQPEDVKKIFQKQGFNFVKLFSPGLSHYGLIFQK